MPSTTYNLSASLSLLLINCVLAQNPVVQLAPNETSARAAAGGGLSSIISPSFAGMGIEPSNLFSFTGHTRTNVLSMNLLANLANYTGVPPHLRIGGNTADNFMYNASYTDLNIMNNPTASGQGNIATDFFTYGPGYFTALDRFPVGTPITFGLNLAYNGPNYIQHIVDAANASVNGLSRVNLVSYEIGNEVDLYVQNNFRTNSWNGRTYTQAWLERAAAVFEQVLKPHNIASNFFEPAATANTNGNTWGIDLLASYGILTPANGSTNNATYVAAFNQHDYYYYIGITAGPITMDRFMDLSTTYAQIANWIPQTQEAYQLGYTYVLREYGSIGPTGITGLSDTFGAALWTLNFFLWAASLNMSSVEIHMTDNSYSAPWQPGFMNGVGPNVRPSYYAFAAMAQIIGASCSTRVQKMPVQYPSAEYANHLSVYSVYRSDSLYALTFINTIVSNASQPHASLDFQVALPSFKGQTLHLSYLSANGTDSMNGTEWNGISYEGSDANGISSSVANSLSRTVTVPDNGLVTITVRDAQAVVAAIGRDPVGAGVGAEYDQAACNRLSDQRPEPRAYHNPSATANLLPMSTTASPGSTKTNGAPNSGPDTSRCTTCKSGAPSLSVSHYGSFAALTMAVLAGAALLL